MDAASVAERERKASARALRAFLAERGEGFEYVARRAGISFPRASALISGANPSFEEAERIARMMREDA